MIEISVPGSKSITNRAVLAAALASGKSRITGALASEDTNHLQKALQQLGISVQGAETAMQIRGGKLGKSRSPLFCGNSGITMRFLAAVLATQPFETILTGEKRMTSRPILDLANTLKQLGAKIEFLKKKGFPPIRVSGPLAGGICRVRGEISSQFLSGLLYAGTLAEKDTEIRVQGKLVSKPYIDMTLEVLQAFGICVAHKKYKRFFIKAGQKWKPRDFIIEGDSSSATYYWGISALTGETIHVKNIPKNSLQPDMTVHKILSSQFLTSPPAHYRLQAADYPDGAMTLAVLAAFRTGKTTLTGLSSWRVKECDRLSAMAAELKKIGVRVKKLPDGLIIDGNPERLHAAKIKTYHDHRMAMCFGMAGFVIPGMKIENPGCVKKTYPNFWKDLAALKEKFMAKNIVLTGMRGSGKSKLGAALGRKLGRRFIDLDEVIERTSGTSIAEVVDKKGWHAFRKLEKMAVKKTQHVQNAIIATGGGTMMFPENAKMLKANGRVIYLACDPKHLKLRLFGKTDRPSLAGQKDFLAEIEEVFAKRKKRYEETADQILETSFTSSDKKRDLEKKLQKLEYVISRMGLL